METALTSPTFARGLWPETWRVLTLNTKNVLIYISFMLAIAILPELLTKDGEMSGLWIAQCIAAALLAIPAHLTVLRNNPTLDTTAKAATMSFVWRGIVIGGLSSLPCLMVMILLIVKFGQGVVLATVVFSLLWLVLGSAAFAKWGTALPAAVIDGTKSFSRAGQRGSLTFGYSFPRLLLSFGTITFLQFAVVVGATLIFKSSDRVFPIEGGVDIPLLLALAAGLLIGAYGLVMTAVILSRAYLMAEQQFRAPDFG